MGGVGKRETAEGKTLNPGCVSHATNIVEHPNCGAASHAAAKLSARECDGRTDCGFAQSPFAKRVHESIMWAKLRSRLRRRADR